MFSELFQAATNSLTVHANVHLVVDCQRISIESYIDTYIVTSITRCATSRTFKTIYIRLSHFRVCRRTFPRLVSLPNGTFNYGSEVYVWRELKFLRKLLDT